MRILINTNGQKGFSLLELLVVIAILGILAAIVGPRLLGRTDDAKRTAAITQIGSLHMAIKMFRSDNGFYPSTEQGLEALVMQPTAGREAKSYRKGGYLDKGKVPLDPWQNEYQYISPGLEGEFDIISLGADDMEGGAEYDADITNWQ